MFLFRFPRFSLPFLFQNTADSKINDATNELNLFLKLANAAALVVAVTKICNKISTTAVLA